MKPKMHDESVYARRALRAGTRGAITKQENAQLFRVKAGGKVAGMNPLPQHH